MSKPEIIGHLHYPTAFFGSAAKADLVVAGAAGVFDPAAAAAFRRVHVDDSVVMEWVHAHVDRAHASGTLKLELWRNRGYGFGPSSSYGTMTLLANITIAAGLLDGATLNFAFVSESLRRVQRSDYLHLQATEKAGGAGWSTDVDCHFVR